MVWCDVLWCGAVHYLFLPPLFLTTPPRTLYSTHLTFSLINFNNSNCTHSHAHTFTGQVFEDSFHQLRMRTAEEMGGRLQVNFHGEEGTVTVFLSLVLFSV